MLKYEGGVMLTRPYMTIRKQYLPESLRKLNARNRPGKLKRFVKWMFNI